MRWIERASVWYEWVHAFGHDLAHWLLSPITPLGHLKTFQWLVRAIRWLWVPTIRTLVALLLCIPLLLISCFPIACLRYPQNSNGASYNAVSLRRWLCVSTLWVGIFLFFQWGPGITVLLPPLMWLVLVCFLLGRLEEWRQRELEYSTLQVSPPPLKNAKTSVTLELGPNTGLVCSPLSDISPTSVSETETSVLELEEEEQPSGERRKQNQRSQSEALKLFSVFRTQGGSRTPEPARDRTVLNKKLSNSADSSPVPTLARGQ